MVISSCIQRRVLRDKTGSERKDEEENADSETMAVELKEENEHKAEIIDQESYEKTKISIFNDIINILTSGKLSLHTEFKKGERKKKLNEWVRKINDITGDIRADNITYTNNLRNAISIFITRKLGLKAKGNPKKCGQCCDDKSQKS
ncbi:Hypothetical predicted protein [Octopus vulgaris]|uniref:Uncharacterized protein n=1 Tax=Octopus vulgaris TaxID=6645 RepID=A0AA36B8C9_OCTVU|nr:Hypothetical predicted protein [Octopus vulgaris]